jgi:signal transduction histidine kinase
MKRRLALSILVSVWSMLLIGGVVGYVGMRSILVQDLDDLLYARACALPELLHSPQSDSSRVPQYDWNDQYTIETQSSATRNNSRAGEMPVVLSADFVERENAPRRRLLTIHASAPGEDGQPIPVIVSYSGSAERLDHLLQRTRVWLTVFGIAVGAAAAAVAMWVASIVLRPLQSTVSLLAAIDEENLGARIEPQQLPAELVPVSDGVNEMLARLQRAFVGHRQFLTHVAYDLRSPVAELAARLDTLEQQLRADEAQRESVSQLRTQIDALGTLITRLSECGVDADEIDDDPVATDITTLINEVADEVLPLAQSKKLTIARTGPHALCCRLSPRRLRSIAYNLLRNASDDSRPGGVIEIGFFHDGRRLHVRVCDDGAGIETDNLPHLFTAIVTASSGQLATYRGLSLFIVQTHLKAMHGTCRVDTAPGEGTAFVLEVPCEVVLPEGMLDSLPESSDLSAGGV